MSTVLGDGKYSYRVIDDWVKLPEDYEFTDVGSVAVDRDDYVYVFNRGTRPMMVFDSRGNFVTSWGEGIFSRPHGLSIDADGNLLCTDDGDHTVRKFTTSGKLLLTLGVPGKASAFMSGVPFHRCTHTAVAEDGAIYVADGYGNAAVHKFAPDGKLLTSWGKPGTGPGEFNLVHNIVVDADGWVYVADRENHRIQVFSADGKYETQWHDLHRPCALVHYLDGDESLFIVGELGPALMANLRYKNLGPRISIMDSDGRVISRLGGADGPGVGDGEFMAPHGIAVDSKGSIYVGEVPYINWGQSFPDRPRPEKLRSLQKLERIGASI
ncbi:peptidyl-alpha-hydroxyglycine alpha-amidating lyase family protein [Dactylosporangium sp. NPDC051484]|uniref:peptidyl-alpha-hydroxyglycine alpha-amidating lyase family protein n=1 Tax=Dactylosporangium sp. NPDC051484 TaxID=3154942 RepID=UPI00344C6A6E